MINNIWVRTKSYVFSEIAVRAVGFNSLKKAKKHYKPGDGAVWRAILQQYTEGDINNCKPYDTVSDAQQELEERSCMLQVSEEHLSVTESWIEYRLGGKKTVRCIQYRELKREE